MLLQQCHQTYLLLDERQPARSLMLDERQPARSLMRDARARRSAIRRRLRELLRVPARRIGAEVRHA